MVELGIDAWWFDATEPDNDYELLHRRVANNTIPGEVYRNVYPLVVNRAMYEGFRERDPEHMPVVLTRSAFAGAQRYGIITWSGDVSGDWITLRRQITGGLGQMAAGLPWWTYDAGGFNRPANQYTDPAYQECMLRWIETAVFLPFMRVHGMSSRTEPWNYSPETQRIYIENIRLRYQLMPYILACAKRVSDDGYTLMRPLVFDFPDDEEALRQDCEYMFGPDYLVCPVTQPGVSKWKVYLPENKAGWEDFRDGTHYDGGQTVCVPVTLDRIPVFKRL
jgi:alpha-D-xyloside xylohydrolase